MKHILHLKIITDTTSESLVSEPKLLFSQNVWDIPYQDNAQEEELIALPYLKL